MIEMILPLNDIIKINIEVDWRFSYNPYVLTKQINQTQTIILNYNFDCGNASSPVHQGFMVPFFPETRGNWKLSPLVPLVWTIDVRFIL